jgi:hypothetical protein
MENFAYAHPKLAQPNRTTQAPYRLLKSVAELSCGYDNADIQGDNLDALKVLLPYFAGKVKSSKQSTTGPQQIYNLPTPTTACGLPHCLKSTPDRGSANRKFEQK